MRLSSKVISSQNHTEQVIYKLAVNTRSIALQKFLKNCFFGSYFFPDSSKKTLNKYATVSLYYL